MSGSVVFDYPTWALQYPELVAKGNAPQAQVFFNEATIYVDNTERSRIEDLTVRTMILYMVTAHIAALNGPDSSPLVGRVASAGEGSVNVSAELAGIPGSASWFVQTKYGLAAWQAMAAYRKMHYIPNWRSRRNFYPGCGFTSL